MDETLGVVVPTLNGGERIRRLVTALRAQERPVDDIVVVDDGSTDRTVEILRALGVRTIRHERNHGAAAARNSGIEACGCSIVAFLDDDCEPDSRWSGALLAAYGDGVVGVGGRVLPEARNPYVRRYLRRHNPLRPLEADLGSSSSPLFRLRLYVKRQFQNDDLDEMRPVWAFAGANMSFRRDALVRAGMLDPDLYFGGEDTDVCRRVVELVPGSLLIHSPAALVVHHFDSRLRAMVRRSWVYGRASAWLYLRQPAGFPTVFPGPSLFVVLAAILIRRGRTVPALALPFVLYPSGIYAALFRRQPDALVDPVMNLLCEGADNVGFVAGVIGELRRRGAACAAATGRPGSRVQARRDG